jgi:hypothetical protein
MASGFIVATANALLDKLLGASNDGTWPATVYIGLSTADPGADGSGFTEPVGNGYARIAVTNDGAGWSVAAAAEKPNAALIEFAAASGGAWGTLNHFGIFDALGGGNLRHWGPLDTPTLVDDGEDVDFPAGSLKVKFQNVA